MPDTIQITKHENEKFHSQTVFLSGHGYINCEFKDCTLVLTNSQTHLEGCEFLNCNWRIEYDVLWGDRRTLENLLKILKALQGSSTLATDRAIEVQ